MLERLDNREIAAVFYGMADLLLIQGGDPYRVRAFERSARVLENLAEPAAVLVQRNALQKLPGVGPGTLHRVKQILRTGTCDDMRRLSAMLPSGLRDMLELKGVGPRTVRVIWQYLRIGTVDELEIACLAGQVRKLPRMAERTESRILESIAAWRQRIGRVPLAKARSTGERIVRAMRAIPQVVQAELGGSARRGKSTVGDLDVLVGADEGGPVVRAFVDQPDVGEVLWAGDGRASVRLRSRQQVDLRIIPPENFGAGLHYFTGSQLHNIAIRARGNRLGVKISEHGIFLRADDRRLRSGEREEEIFEAVGLPYIAPELRENLGEIEAAAAGRLPELVTADDLHGDLHLHTTASDGKGTLQQMVSAAVDLGHRFLAITDHSQALEVANGLDVARLRAQGDAIRVLEDRVARIRLLRGIEVDILPDGSLDLEPSALRDLDWVVASVHSELDQPPEQMTARLVRAMETGLVDCIGHPTNRQLGIRDGSGFDMETVLRAALRTGVALEVNGSPKRMDLDDVAARQCREAGVPVAVNTDAHAPEHLPYRDYGLAVARRAWLERRHVVNCWSAETLLERRRDRLRRGGATVSMSVVPAKEPRVTLPAAPGAVDALASALSDPTALDEALLARLDRFLIDGDDEDLEAALGKLGDNPVQTAFNLSFLARANSGEG